MDKIEELLTRGVDKIYPSKEALEKILRSGKKLKLYQGFDPTGTQLHIGHAVGFRKLRQFQDLGHEVIFLIGDGTGQAGDPSGKKRSREKYLASEELRKNGRDYVMQASKIVRIDGDNPVKILYNGDWLNRLTLAQILDVAGHFTLQQMLERDLYQERLKANQDVSFREFLYPLLQGYDSVAMEVDLELGGSDQTFNMLVGRKLVGAILHKEKFVITTPLLTDSKGIKIGKTEGNVIGITDPPNDFYSKIMSLSDDVILPSFTLLTNTPLDEIDSMKKEIASGINPMNFKKKLAFELTKQFNSKLEAEKAHVNFSQIFQKQDLSTVELELRFVNEGTQKLIDLVSMFISSKSESKRRILAGAVEYNGKRIINPSEEIRTKKGDTIKVGSHTMYRLDIKS